MSYLSVLKALKGVCAVIAAVGLMFVCSAEPFKFMSLLQFIEIWGGCILATFIALFVLNKLEAAEKSELEYQKYINRRHQK